jgi:hypothetical protein
VNDGRTTKERGLSSQRPARKSADADRWFDLELNRIYSDVINEPLPNDFLDLVAKLGQCKTGKR